VPQPCPHCDQPDLSLLRLVLIGEILLADQPWLLRLVDVLQHSGLLDFAEQPTALHQGRPQGTLQTLRRSGTGHP
jgi:hypothetical protein